MAEEPKEPDRDRAYVEDIVDSATRIRRYVGGATFDEFQANDLLQDAVLRRLMVIGEAAACLSESFKRETEAVPWRRVVAFRNLVVHHYWPVDLEIVWRIVNEEVPILVLDELFP
jgi:uncharacterized protein with HEPN domain